MIFSPLKLAATSAFSIAIPLAIASAQSLPSMPQAPSVPSITKAADVTGAAQAQGSAGWGFLKCPATGGKHEVGAGIGTVVGGVAGNRIGGEDNRVVGTAIGAGVGAAAGAWIGCRLQVGDQRRAEEARQRALAEDRNQTWSNSQTGASGEVRVTRTYTRTPVTRTVARPVATPPAPKLAALKFLPGVALEHRYESLSGDYRALRTANVRAGSSTSTSIVGQLTAGETINVVGKSVDKPWYLIAKNDTAIGYVYSSLLTANMNRPVETTYVQETSYTQKPSPCRVVEEVITVSGEVTTSSYKACPTAEGGWKMTQI